MGERAEALLRRQLHAALADVGRLAQDNARLRERLQSAATSAADIGAPAAEPAARGDDLVRELRFRLRHMEREWRDREAHWRVEVEAREGRERRAEAARAALWRQLQSSRRALQSVCGGVRERVGALERLLLHAPAERTSRGEAGVGPSATPAVKAVLDDLLHRVVASAELQAAAAAGAPQPADAAGEGKDEAPERAPEAAVAGAGGVRGGGEEAVLAALLQSDQECRRLRVRVGELERAMQQQGATVERWREEAARVPLLEAVVHRTVAEREALLLETRQDQGARQGDGADDGQEEQVVAALLEAADDLQDARRESSTQARDSAAALLSMADHRRGVTASATAAAPKQVRRVGQVHAVFLPSTLPPTPRAPPSPDALLSTGTTSSSPDDDEADADDGRSSGGSERFERLMAYSAQLLGRVDGTIRRIERRVAE